MAAFSLPRRASSAFMVSSDMACSLSSLSSIGRSRAYRYRRAIGIQSRRMPGARRRRHAIIRLLFVATNRVGGMLAQARPSPRTNRESAMRIYWLIGLLALTAPDQACAWGPEGHSIVAEIAQRKLAREAPDIAQKIAAIMGPGESLASIASWADDFRDEHKSTTNWHFVNIPIASSTFDPETQCKADDPEGDCIIAELDRLKSALRCKSGDEQKQAL